ncbi:hypothetical protein Sjap_021529 [Stephania japonica]|uniref:Uncharacterized protein n=1 Tax=Stephania japonica TaxID=461633 RepID=A0AAP0ESF3_9MAGN
MPFHIYKIQIVKNHNHSTSFSSLRLLTLASSLSSLWFAQNRQNRSFNTYKYSDRERDGGSSGLTSKSSRRAVFFVSESSRVTREEGGAVQSSRVTRVGVDEKMILDCVLCAYM